MSKLLSCLCILLFIYCDTNPFEQNTIPDDYQDILGPLQPPDASNKLAIGIEQIEDFREQYNFVGIVGSVTNNTDSLYYSKLGDGFNWSTDQERLTIADLTTGYVERYDEDEGEWEVFKTHTIFYEGSRFVQIQPHRKYQLIVNVSSLLRPINGKFRLRIDYFNEIDPSENAIPIKDYSEVFEIKKIP